MKKSKDRKLNYTLNLTETNGKRLFLHLKRIMNSTENTDSKEKQCNCLKFKPKINPLQKKTKK